MKTVEFYKDRNDRSVVKEFLKQLSQKEISKVSWVIELLSKTEILGLPYTRHLEGKIWELRPQSIRILFFWQQDTAIILHAFKKKTQKTPKAEINIALNRMKDLLERSE